MGLLISLLGFSFAVTSYAWHIQSFTDLVVFGDSWTDDGRLNYIASHNGSVPPVGWVGDSVGSLESTPY